MSYKDDHAISTPRALIKIMAIMSGPGGDTFIEVRVQAVRFEATPSARSAAYGQ